MDKYKNADNYTGSYTGNYSGVFSEGFPERLSTEDRQFLEDLRAGRVLPPLWSDIIAKTVFNADVHPDRLNFLLRGIAKDETIDVRSSAANEAFRQSVYTKGMISDIPSWLRDNRLADIEIQKAKQNFIFTRAELYASDMLLLQYSVTEGKKKSDLHFTDVKEVLLVVLMVQSPRAFTEYDVKCDKYIHRFTKMVADTGLTYPAKARIIYVQLDKCLKQLRQGFNGETDHIHTNTDNAGGSTEDYGKDIAAKQEDTDTDAERERSDTLQLPGHSMVSSAIRMTNAERERSDALQLMLAMIADINDETVVKAAEKNDRLKEIRAETYNMGQDREVQNMLMQEKYDRMDWYSYGYQERTEGKIEGKIESLISLIQKKIRKGKTLDNIIDELESDYETIHPIYITVNEMGTDCDPERILEAMKMEEA